VAHQKIIQALASGIFLDQKLPHCHCCGLGGSVIGLFALYNVFHLRAIFVSG
jgi:hypothetical protein